VSLSEFKPDPDWAKGFVKEFGRALQSATNKKHRGYRGSGSMALDIALGGGWGRCVVVQLTGKEGSGKTLLADLAAIEAARVEKKRYLIFDFEATWDPQRFAQLGGDLSMVDYIGHENCKPMLLADIAFDMLKSVLVNTDQYAVVLFDSTAAMLPKAAYEKKMEQGQESSVPFVLAKVMSEGLTITTGLMASNPAEPTIFYVSQGRDKVDGSSFGKGPPPDKQTGGRALPFFASVRVDVRKGDVMRADVEELGLKDIEIGHVTKVIVKKNKLNGAQGRVAEFDWYNEGDFKGIDRVSELVKLARYAHTDGRSGSWYAIRQTPGVERPARVQGEAEFKALLRADVALYDDLQIRTQIALAKIMDATAPVEVEDGEND
jgi:recombination protein RecA